MKQAKAPCGSTDLGEADGRDHIGTMSDAPLPEQTAKAMEIEAARVLETLPAQLRDQLHDIVVQVEEFATAEQLAAVDMTSRWQLTGLYEGNPLAERSVWNATEMPAIISLFRQPLLREWRETGVEWSDLIRHVVIHEAGHHFGFSDEEMHALEDEA